MRALPSLLFLSVMLLATGGAHYYLWVRLVRDPAWPGPWPRLFAGLLTLLWLSIPLGLMLRTGLGQWFGRGFRLALAAWLGVMFLLLVSVAAADALRWGLSLAQRWGALPEPVDPARRLTVARLFALAATVVGGGSSVVALRSGLAKVGVERVEVPLGRLPRALDGSSIVQLTDIHVGPTIRRDFVEQIVATTNALEPDVIAITGDLVDGSVEQLREHVAPLAQLRAKYGVFFVTGNHEYYSGAEEWCRELERLGLRVLRNERVSIGEGADSYDLAGVSDYSAGSFGDGPDLARAVSGRDPTRELVLLAHQPREVRRAREHGVGLQLSGHTHGGQLWPWRPFVLLQQPRIAGLAKLGETWVYVSRGTGYWGPPMRLASPAEITHVVLKRAS